MFITDDFGNKNFLTRIGQVIAIVVMYASFNDAFSNSYTVDW
jgi:hypothetical protein